VNTTGAPQQVLVGSETVTLPSNVFFGLHVEDGLLSVGAFAGLTSPLLVSGDLEVEVSTSELSVTIGSEAQQARLTAGLPGIGVGLDVQAYGSLAVLANGGGTYGNLAATLGGPIVANDFFTLGRAGDGLDVAINSTAAWHGEMAPSSFRMALDTSMSFFDAVDLNAQLAIAAQPNALAISGDGTLSTDVLENVGGPRIDAAQVSADIDIHDGRADALFQGSFLDVGLEAALSRYGCFQVSLGDLGFAVPLTDGACAQRVYVDDQDFVEADSTTYANVLVQATRPAELRLLVPYTVTEHGVQITAGTLEIPQGHSTGTIRLTVSGDDAVNPDRQLTVTLGQPSYVRPDWDVLALLPIPAVIDDRDTAVITIREDDVLRPVLISVPPLVTVTEGEAGQITVSAYNLAAGESVTLGWSLVPQNVDLSAATSGWDFRDLKIGRVRLTADAPSQTISFATVEDRAYELNEGVTVQFRVVSSATSAPYTLIGSQSLSGKVVVQDRTRVVILNDDQDRQPEFLVFYDFDQPLGTGYVYDKSAEVVSVANPLLTRLRTAIVASDFTHRDDVPNFALHFDGSADHVVAVRNTLLRDPALPSGPFTVDFWIRADGYSTTQAATLLSMGDLRISIGTNGSIRAQLGSSVGVLGNCTPGAWQHVVVSYSGGGANGLKGFLLDDDGHVQGYFSTTGPAATGLASVTSFTLGNNASHTQPYTGVMDGFRVRSSADISDLTSPTALLIEYQFDEGSGNTLVNRTGKGWQATLGTDASGMPSWVTEDASPAAPLGGYQNASQDVTGVAKVSPVSPADPVSAQDPSRVLSTTSSAISAGNWAEEDLRLAPSVADYYHFTVALGRAELFALSRVAQTSMTVTGVDFFDLASQYGPVHWSLRSSLDNFSTVLAEGDTSQGLDYGHQRVLFDTPLRITTGNTIEFRLYADGGLVSRYKSGGTWSIDNFALIGFVGNNSAPVVGQPIGLDVPVGNFSDDLRARVLSPTHVSDADGDPVEIVEYSAPAGTGYFSNSPIDGTLTFRVAEGVSGAAIPLTLVLADPWGNTTTDVVMVNPIGNLMSDDFTVKPQVATVLNVLGNDKLPSSDEVWVEIQKAPRYGTAVVQKDGSISYTALRYDASGQPVTADSFSYAVLGPDWKATQTVAIKVNDVPAAPARLYSLYEDYSLSPNAASGLLAGLSDSQRDTLTAAVTDQPDNGTLTLNADGSFTYAPRTNFWGTDTFQYVVNDSRGATSAPATVTLKVTAQPDPPVAVQDSYRTRAGTPLVVGAAGVLANDSDADGDRSLRAVQVPTHPTYGTWPQHGTVTLQENGGFTYTPAAGFSGQDGFFYRVVDSTGRSSAIVPVVITVDANRAPTAVGDPVATNEDTSIWIPCSTLLANDTDPDGHALTVTGVGTSPQHGTAWLTTNPLTHQPTILYRPSSNYYGPDSFVYTISDGQGGTASATVSITVNRVNDPPVAVADAYSVSGGGTLTKDFLSGVLANDTDVDLSIATKERLTATLVTGPAHAASFSLLTYGGFSYTPASGFSGTDTFTYVARDGAGGQSAPATVSISVSPFVIKAVVVKSYAEGSMLFLDTDLDGVWDFTDADADGQPDAGSPAEPRGFTGPDGSVDLAIPPAADLDGNGTIEPLEGVLVATGGFNITTLQQLGLTLSAPVGAAVITPLTTLVTTLALERGYGVAGADLQVRAALGLPDVAVLEADPVALAATGSAEGSRLLAVQAQLANTYAGAAAFLAAASGATARDAGAAVLSALAARIDPAPTTIDFTDPNVLALLLEDAAGYFGPMPNTAALHAVAQVIAEVNGRVDAGSASGAAFVDAVGRIESVMQAVVVPRLAAFGAGREGSDELLEACTGAALDAAIAGTVLGPLVPPSAGGAVLQAVSATGAMEGGLSRLVGAIDGAAPGDHLSIVVSWGDGTTEAIALGTATEFSLDHLYVDDPISGTPADELWVGVALSVNGVATDVVSTALVVENVAPELVGLTSSGAGVAGMPVTLAGTAWDLGVQDALTLAVDWGDGATEILTSFGADGAFALEHTYALAGAYAVSLRLADDDGGEALAQLGLAVSEPLLPVGRDDVYSLDEDQPLVVESGGLLANDESPGGAPLVVELRQAPLHGVLALGSDGAFSYVPEADWSGSDTFRYAITDGSGGWAEANVNLTVLPVNDAPVIGPLDDVRLYEGASQSIQVTAADVEGDAFSFRLDAGAPGVSIDPQTGLLTIAPPDGPAVFHLIVRVTDALGAFGTAAFDLTVDNVAPTLAVFSETQQVAGGEPYSIGLVATDPGDDTISLWRIDWGDGTTLEVAGTAQSASHAYARSGGSYEIRVHAVDEDGTYEAAPHQVSVTPNSLRVTELTAEASGFHVRFNGRIDTSVVNLYQAADAPTLGPADVTVVGTATGAQTGSLVFDTDGYGFRFVKTGGPLAPDTYTVTLASGFAGIKDAFGVLDGNGDQVAGDAYVGNFTVAGGTATLGIPDFMRGPGQAVDVPAGNGAGIPITLTSVGSIRSLVFTIAYDPQLLQLTGVTEGNRLPKGATLSVDLGTPGLATVTLLSPKPLAKGEITLGSLVATVPASASYGAVERIDLTVLSVNGGDAAGVVADDAVHVVGYLGDVNTTGSYDQGDVERIMAVAAGTDSGFSAWQVIDPVVVADVKVDGAVTKLDAKRIEHAIRRDGVGHDIPPLPATAFEWLTTTASRSDQIRFAPLDGPIQSFVTTGFERLDVAVVATEAPVPPATVPVSAGVTAGIATPAPRIDLGTILEDSTLTPPPWSRTGPADDWRTAFLGLSSEPGSRYNPNSRIKIGTPR
jgi:hypothetical protein